MNNLAHNFALQMPVWGAKTNAIGGGVIVAGFIQAAPKMEGYFSMNMKP